MKLPRDLAQRLLMLALLAGCAGAALWWARREDLRATPPAVTGPLFPGLSAHEIEFLHLGLRLGYDIELEREASGFWWITQPTREFPLQARVQAVLDTLVRAELEPVELAHGPITSADVGLDPPRHVIAFRAGGRSETLLLGDVEPLGRHVYARRGGEDRILLATRNLVTLLEAHPGEFVDPALLRGLAGRVARLELSSSRGTLEAERLAQGWTLRRPEGVLADDDRLDQLLRALQFVQVARVAGPEPTDTQLLAAGLPTRAEAASGQAGPWLHVRVEAPGEEPAEAWLAGGWESAAGEVLAVRDDFAKLLAVPRASLNLLANAPEWFRQARLLPPLRERAESLRLEREGQVLLDIRRTAGGQWSFEAPQRLHGERVEAERVEGRSPLGEFLGRIDALAARSYTAPPAGEPWARLLAGSTHASRPRLDSVAIHRVEGRLVAVTSERPTEGLELPPDAAEIFDALVPDLLRTLRPLTADAAAWAGLRVRLADGRELGLRRLPDGSWEGDDEWTRASALGHDLLRTLRGLRWEAAPASADHPWRVTFLDAAGDPIAGLRLRLPGPDEPQEALGLPCVRAAIDGWPGVELLVHRDWLRRVEELGAPLQRGP